MKTETLIKRFKSVVGFFSGSDYYYNENWDKPRTEICDFMIKEIKYWISCCYEGGHTLNDMLTDDLYGCEVISHINKAKKFISYIRKHKNDKETSKKNNIKNV